MFFTKRSWRKARLLLLLSMSAIVLSACTGALNNGSWQSLSAEGDIVYVSRGSDVRAVNVVDQREVWGFPEDGNSQLNFFAPAEVQGDDIILGDYGAASGFFSPNVIVSVYALDASSGNLPSTRWIASEVAADRIIGQPFLDGNTVYVTTADNFLFALDAENGNLLWSFEAEHSFWAQPLVVDGTVYLSSMDHTLYALNATDGDIRWQARLNGALPSAPAYENGILYVGSFSGNMYAIDAATGDELWSYGAEDWIWSTPSVAGSMILFADESGTIYAVSNSGEEMWRQQAAGAIQAETLVHGDLVYIASVGDEDEEQGQVLALNLDDGSILWEKQTDAPIYSSMVVVDDSLVVAVNSDDALLTLYDLQNGAEGWNYSPED